MLEKDRTVKLGKALDEQADRVYDLNGKSLATGFIDGHSHYDWFAIKKEPLPFFAPFIRQGIATFVTGNCGISTIAFEPGCPHVDKLGGGIFSFKGTTGEYGTVEELFSAVDGHIPCSLVVLAGHCSARAAISGNVNRKLTPEEEEQMLAILEKALQQGAVGLSLGMMYEPGLYADVEEQRKIAQLCVKYNKPLTVPPGQNPRFRWCIPSSLAVRTCCAPLTSWGRFPGGRPSSSTTLTQSLSDAARSKTKASF